MQHFSGKYFWIVLERIIVALWFAYCGNVSGRVREERFFTCSWRLGRKRQLDPPAIQVFCFGCWDLCRNPLADLERNSVAGGAMHD